MIGAIRRSGGLLSGTLFFALAGCAGSRQVSTLPQPLAVARAAHTTANDEAATGMCSIYSGFGSLSFCYNFDEASGTTLIDSSSAGHNGTIASSGVTYQAPGLTSNSTYAETTNGSTGSMTSGFSPAAGSFSVSFFVRLRSNAKNHARLAETGYPAHSTPASGWFIGVDAVSGNDIYAGMGYGSGNVDFGDLPLALECRHR